jgi:putative Mg2+ transporter-C (MgtC) family protein
VDTGEMVVRIVLAAALGGLLGAEREISDQPAGLRTHILVSLGAALFTLVGTFGASLLQEGEATVRLDPTRVAAQVVTGIGFLGAGAIIQQGLSIRGLTTAASLWVTAAIGTAVGIGFYSAALATAVITVASLLGLKPLERRLLIRLSRGRRSLIVETAPDFRLAQLRRALENLGVTVLGIKVAAESEGREQYVVSVRVPRGQSPEEVLRAAHDTPGVSRMDWFS